MNEFQNNEELPMSPGEAMIAMSRQFTGEQRHNGIRFLQAMEERDPFSCTAISMPGMAFWNSSAKTPEQKAHIIDRANTLQKGINLELWQKLEITERIIKRALQEDTKWALSYSGGRDSTVLSHIIVERLGLKIPHVMSNTRMEYPETIKQVKNWYERIRAHDVECHVCFPDRRPNELWKDIGVPLWSKEIAYKYRKFFKSASDKISTHVPAALHAEFRKAKALGLKITDKCCDELKKKPMKKWDKVHGIGGHFMGVRCAESRARRLAWIQKGALYQAVSHGNLWVANPLAFWTLENIEQWLSDHKLTVLRPDTPTGGSGCVTCMFGCQARAADGTKNNMQDLKERNPKMWRAALDEWGYRDVLDKMEIPYE
jgi:3'-phosphoadenosine 5'-phosphosulfate sulfotransferase (PAPS reductase)/FAD synthetase